MTKADDLRVMRERRFQKAKLAKPAKSSRGGAEGRAIAVTATLSKKGSLGKAEAGIEPGPRETVNWGDKVVEFATAVLHGDEEHKKWLLSAAASFVDGKPFPKAKKSVAKCTVCEARRQAKSASMAKWRASKTP